MKKKWFLFVLLLLSLPLYFLTASHWSLHDADESFYANITREMIQDGDWLTPHYNGAPFFQKSPLVFWLAAISYKIFGINEVSTRLPIIILAIMCIFLVYLIAQELFHDFYTSLLSSIILLTSYHFLYIGHLLMMDVPTIFFILLGLYGLLHSSVKKEWAILYGLSLGFAILSKGVLGITLVICILPYIFWQKKFSYFRNSYLWIGLVCGILLCGSWYFYEMHIYGNDFLKIHFWQQVVQRSQKEMHPSGNLGILFYPIQVLLNFFPWSIILIFSLFENIKGFLKKSEEHSFIVSWIITFFIIIVAMRTKLPHYCLPLYPFFAISVGQFIRKSFENCPIPTFSGINYIYLIFSFILLFVTVSVMVIPKYSIYQKYVPVAFAVSIFFIFLSLFYLFENNKRMFIGQVWIKLLVGGTYVLLIFAILNLKIWDFNPEIKQLSKLEISEHIYFISPLDRPDFGDAVRFYFGPSRVTGTDFKEAGEILQTQRESVLLTNIEMLKEVGFKEYRIIAQSGSWVFVKPIIK